MTFERWFQPLREVLLVDAEKFKSLKKLWFRAYAYHGEILTSPRLEMYAEDCMDLTLSDVEVALHTFRNAPPPEGHKPRPPLPVDVRATLNTTLAPEARANAIAASIYAAIGKYGKPNQSSAEQYLGELAWAVVDRMGGWAGLCETAKPERRDTFHAQVRDVARVAIQHETHGNIDAYRLLAQRKAQADQFEAPKRPTLRKMSSILEAPEERKHAN